MYQNIDDKEEKQRKGKHQKLNIEMILERLNINILI